MSTVNISITSDQVKFVDEMTKQMDFANRSEFFRALLRLVARKPQVLEKTGEFSFQAPDLKSASRVVSSMKATKKYNQKFLDSLEQGLVESGYFTK